MSKWVMRTISDIYVSRAFQWYMERLNPMGFGPCNCSLKIRESIRTPSPKVGAHLGVWGFIPSHFPTLVGTWNVTPELPSWPAPLQALALVPSPRLRLRHLSFCFPFFHLKFVDSYLHNLFFYIHGFIFVAKNIIMVDIMHSKCV